MSSPFGSDDQSWTHAVLFYMDEGFLLRVLAEYMADSLRKNHGAVVLATRAYRRGLLEKLSAFGIDGASLKNTRRYIEIDVDEVHTQCSTDGKFDLSRLAQIIEPGIASVVQSTASNGSSPPVTVFGELVALRMAKDGVNAALDVEAFWEQLAKHYSFSLLCGYPIKNFASTGTEDCYLRICSTHSILIPPDDYPTVDCERRIMEATARSYANLGTNSTDNHC